MTLKIRSTKSRTKVRKVVKYQEDFLGYYNKKKGQYNPHEEPVEIVNLGTEEDKKEVKIGANLEPSVKNFLTQLLHDYVEVFAWSYEDMPGLDTDILVHCLPTKEDCPPVKQKVRRMQP